MTHQEATSLRQATAVEIHLLQTQDLRHITDQPETNTGQQTALPNLLPENAPAAQLKTSRYGRAINQDPKYKP